MVVAVGDVGGINPPFPDMRIMKIKMMDCLTKQRFFFSFFLSSFYIFLHFSFFFLSFFFSSLVYTLAACYCLDLFLLVVYLSVTLNK